MRDELIKALAGWEEGAVEAADLHARFPDDDLQSLLIMHSSLGAIAAAEPALDTDRVWSTIQQRIAERPSNLYRRIRDALSRPFVALAASVLLGGGVAYAADLGPVREGVHSVVKSVGRVLGIVSDDSDGKGDRPAILPGSTEEPGKTSDNSNGDTEQEVTPGSNDGGDESNDGDPSGDEDEGESRDRAGGNDGDDEGDPDAGNDEGSDPSDDPSDHGDDGGSDEAPDGDGDPDEPDVDEPDVDEPAEPGVDDPGMDGPDEPDTEDPDGDEPDDPDEAGGDGADQSDEDGPDDPDDPLIPIS